MHVDIERAAQAMLAHEAPRYHGGDGDRPGTELQWERVDPAGPDEHGGQQVVVLVAERAREDVDNDLRLRSRTFKKLKLELYRSDATGTAYSLRLSEQLIGLHRRTKSVYSTWRTVKYVKMRVLPDGRWLRTTSYKSTGRRGYVSSHVYGTIGLEPFAAVLPPPVSVEEFSPLGSALFARPMYGDGLADRFSAPSYFVGRLADVQDVPELTRRLFGTRAYRKDLAREVGEVATRMMQGERREQTEVLGRLQMAWMLRGLVPVDWLVTVLRGQGAASSGVHWLQEREVCNLRAHLRQLDVRSLRRLVLRQHAVASIFLSDIARAAAVPGLTRVDSWTDLHDRVLPPAMAHLGMDAGADAEQWNKAQALDFAVTRPTRFHKDLDGTTTAAGRTIVVARTGAQLREWAEEMQHCIASYQLQMWRKTSLLGAVLDADGTLLGNFEVVLNRHDQAALRQLLGRRNANLPADVVADVVSHLGTYGVVARNFLGETRVGLVA